VPSAKMPAAWRRACRHGAGRCPAEPTRRRAMPGGPAIPFAVTNPLIDGNRTSGTTGSGKVRMGGTRNGDAGARRISPPREIVRQVSIAFGVLALLVPLWQFDWSARYPSPPGANRGKQNGRDATAGRRGCHPFGLHRPLRIGLNAAAAGPAVHAARPPSTASSETHTDRGDRDG